MVHGLLEDDADRGVQFSEIMLNMIKEDPAVLDNIVWTDEASFNFGSTLSFGVIEPIFFYGTVTGSDSLEIIKNQVVPQLQQPYSQNIYFEQDEAPLHYSREVREYLDKIFPEK